MDLNVHETWKPLLEQEVQKPYMIALKEFLKAEVQAGKPLLPPASKTFHALKITPLPEVKCVILAQDPYHGPGQAMGLSFSVPPGVPKPKSLQRIFKELHDDVGVPIPSHGDLTRWAEKEGVLLLNTILSVAPGIAKSHRNKGWEQFTDHIISCINEYTEHTVFMLWGKDARQKKELINEENHCILEAAHPSPLAGTAFLGNRHFSQCNEYLSSHGKNVIDWSLVP